MARKPCFLSAIRKMRGNCNQCSVSRAKSFTDAQKNRRVFALDYLPAMLHLINGSYCNI